MEKRRTNAHDKAALTGAEALLANGGFRLELVKAISHELRQKHRGVLATDVLALKGTDHVDADADARTSRMTLQADARHLPKAPRFQKPCARVVENYQVVRPFDAEQIRFSVGQERHKGSFEGKRDHEAQRRKILKQDAGTQQQRAVHAAKGADPAAAKATITSGLLVGTHDKPLWHALFYGALHNVVGRGNGLVYFYGIIQHGFAT